METRSAPTRADGPSTRPLAGRVCLVTGASSGLGARFVEVLHEAGADVVATARRSDLLDQVASRCGPSVTTMAGDITDPEHRRNVTECIAQSHGRLDVLVNNAGIVDDGPIEDESLDDLRHIIDVNLTSVIDTCRLAAPLLFRSSAATVINVASIYGVVSSRDAMTGYNATKGAIVNFTRQLAAQWGHRGIRVNALAPGYFPSEMTGQLADEEFVEYICEQTLLARIPRSDELDGPLLFLATEASSYVTGQILVVDGGWTAV